jgi:formate/nitrite transporter FocA (FNT family)
VFDQDREYALGLPVIWLGNLAGTFLTALAESATRIGPALAEKARTICTVKLNDGIVSIFFLAFFCNVLIWLAVEGFKNNPHPAGKYLSLFFGVTVFILCGFEHCVANMYYIPAGLFCKALYGVQNDALNWGSFFVKNLIPVTLGNIVGGAGLVGLPYWFVYLRGNKADK